MTRSRGIQHVHPSLIVWRRSSTTPPSFRSVKKQMERLEAEGQIEPIQVLPADEHGTYVIQEDAWAYAEAQVHAARVLEWPTLLITEDTE